MSSYPSNPDSYDINGTIEGSTEKCSFTDSTNFCEFVYFVGLSTQQREQICEVLAPCDCLLIPVWAIALLVLVGLVVIGIIIIVIIKFLIMHLDYREYKSFKKESMKLPRPTITYNNVAYGVTMVTTCCAKTLVIIKVLNILVVEFFIDILLYK